MSKKKQGTKSNQNKQPIVTNAEINKPSREIDYVGRDLKGIGVFLLILGEIVWFIVYCISVIKTA